MRATVLPSPLVLEEFCRRWKIVELSLFGSAERGELTANSDVDLLVSFATEARWSVLEHMSMEEELGELVGRKVDLVSRRAIEQSENWIRRREILASARTVYAA